MSTSSVDSSRWNSYSQTCVKEMTKKRIANERRNRQTAAQTTVGREWCAELEKQGWSHVERGAKKNCGTLARNCDSLLVVNGEKKLDGRFSNGGCVRACDERWRQPSILGCLFQTPPADGSDVAAREADALAQTV